MLIASADYASEHGRGQIAGTALTSFRYYRPLDTVAPVSHSAALGATVRLPKRATVQVNQTAAYSPSYLFQLFPTGPTPAPGDAIPAAPDYRVAKSDSYSYGTSMTLAVGSTRGNRVTASAEYGHTDYRDQRATFPELTTYATRANFSHGVARNGLLSVEYEYRTGGLLDADTIEQRIALGIEYSRALSTKRRAIFRFNLAPSTLDIPKSATNTIVTGRVYRLHADASLDYQFRRTWQASGNYRRGVEYIAVLTEPIFADATRVEVTGLISRRLDLLASVGYAIGESALTRSNRLDTYTGNVRLRFALTRWFALYSEYLYYQYDLGEQRSLVVDLPRAFEQRGIRVGLMLWVRAF